MSSATPGMHILNGCPDSAAYLFRRAYNNAEVTLYTLTQAIHQELLQRLKVIATGFRASKNQRNGLVILRVHQDTQQIEYFLNGADAAGKYNHGMGKPYESLQAFFDIRHNYQFVDDGVR